MLEYNRRANSLSGGVPSELLHAFRVAGRFLLKRVLPVAAILAGVLAGLFLLLRLGDGLAGHDTQPPGAAIARGALSPDGGRVAALRDDGSVEIRRVDGGGAVAQVRGHGAPVIEARFSGDGKQLVTVDAAGGVIVTDMQADGGLREAAHAVSDPGNLHPVVWNDVTRDAWRMGGALERWLSPVSSAARIHNASAVAPMLARGAIPAPGTMFRDCEECPQMVVVPAGKFMMGSPEDEEGRLPNEGPQREIAIIAPIALGRFEVTVNEFQRFVEEAGHAPAAGCAADLDGTEKFAEEASSNWAAPGFAQSAQMPVVCVSWNDAQAYVLWLARKTGATYRMLSEAEWEYAARVDTTTAYPWADALGRDYANYGKDECCGGVVLGPDRWMNTAPVGSFLSNKWGLFDMQGNASEWVRDCWEEDYSGDRPLDGAATLLGTCDLRLIRGGSWGSVPQALRSAARTGSVPALRTSFLGFRVARVL